jgi:hypothetical protein
LYVEQLDPRNLLTGALSVALTELATGDDSDHVCLAIEGAVDDVAVSNTYEGPRDSVLRLWNEGIEGLANALMSRALAGT